MTSIERDGLQEHVTICRRCHGKGYIVVERNGEEGEIRCEACGGYGEARNEHC